MPSSLPGYVKSSSPNPGAMRAPWYKNTFPAYAGIFLWVGFYLGLAGPTISVASPWICLLALLVAGLLCFGLFYYASGMLGMQTGRTLYIVGTSTFGAQGGYFMPGILMGLLQIGWFAVATYFSADYIMSGLHDTSKTLFIVIALIWAYGLAWIAIKGIRYVARLAQFLNWVPLVMLVIVFWANKGGLAHYKPAEQHTGAGFLMILAMVIGFFATAGAAGADFCLSNRSRRDVVLGGLTGITLAAVVAGGLAILSVAGHIGKTGGVPNYDFAATISSVGALAPIMFFLFAAASLTSTCFCAFIISSSFGTMIPQVPRGVSTVVGVSIGALLAATGVAKNLITFFTIVGASFGPICGAMAADYLLAGRKWSGPRRGINWAGYIAWAVGFIVGILKYIPGAPASLVRVDRPAVLWSFIVGFVLYWILAKAGIRPQVVKMESVKTEAATAQEGIA